MTPEGIAEIVSALAHPEDSTQATIQKVLVAVGDGYLATVPQSDDDAYPVDSLSSWLAVTQWASRTAHELTVILESVTPHREDTDTAA